MVMAGGQGRIGDKANVPIDTHGCPGCPHPGTGPAIVGSNNVNVNHLPALRVDDKGIHAACCGTNSWTAKTGARGVFINDKAAFRVGDTSQHCGGRGQLIEGSKNVIIGDNGGGAGGNTAGLASSNDNRSSASGGGGGGGGGAGNRDAPGIAAGPPPIAEEEPRKVTLHGVFKQGERAIAETRFVLRRNSRAGAAITPDTLQGGVTSNQHRDGYWIADREGSYLFREMLPFTYYVIPELGVDGDAPPAAEDPVDGDCGGGGPPGVIWAALFDGDMVHRLVNAAYTIALEDDDTLSGTTDERGELHHEHVETGMYAITVGGGEGTVPARLARVADAPYGVRIVGASS